MKRKLKAITVSGAIILAICLVIFFRASGKKAKADQGEESSLRPVAVALVTRVPLVTTLTLSGAFRPYQEVDVHAKVAGYIRRIYVDVGDKVKQGQVLAILEVPELSAQVAGAKASIGLNQNKIHRSESEIQRALSTYAAYHSAYNRLKNASEARPGLIAEQELDDSLAKDKESEAQVAVARAALAESENQLAVAQANLDQLSALKAYSHITAPFAGVVTKRYADTGALIQAGTASDTQAMPVVQLAEWSRLRLVVPVPESAVPQIRVGALVQVRVPALTRNFQGKVARFADVLDQQTRTMVTEIDVENRNGTLVDGMYAEADLALKGSDGGLTVPIQALHRDGSGASVMLVNSQGQIEQRRVTLGDEGPDWVEIKSGLSAKDEVVVGNRSDFRPGEKVVPRIVNMQPANLGASS